LKTLTKTTKLEHTLLPLTVHIPGETVQLLVLGVGETDNAAGQGT